MSVRKTNERYRDLRSWKVERIGDEQATIQQRGDIDEHSGANEVDFHFGPNLSKLLCIGEGKAEVEQQNRTSGARV